MKSASFQTIWDKHRQCISSALQKKYRWKKNNDNDTWMDVLSEAKVLCFEQFGEYDREKGEIYPFFFYWSEIAFMRFLRQHNTATFGEHRFKSIKHDFPLLRQTFLDEGNPRYLLVFLYDQYLDITADEFLQRGLPHLSLEEVFNDARNRFSGKKTKQKKQLWSDSELDDLFGILWEKIYWTRNDLFYTRKNSFPSVYKDWSSQVKGNFLKIRSLTSSGKSSAAAKRRTDSSFSELPGISAPHDDFERCGAAYAIHSQNPLHMMLVEENIHMQLHLLQFAIKHTDDARHLFAFLFNLCSIKERKFTREKYHLLTLKELTEVFKNEYLLFSPLSERALMPVFALLEQKIRPIEKEVFIDRAGKLRLADWAYNVRQNIVALILRGEGILGKELRRYFIDHSQ
jgi:hypothetical protein